MNNENKHIDFFELTVKYLSGEADAAEEKALEDWVKVSAHNKKQFIQYKRTWQLAASKNIQFNKAEAWEKIKEGMNLEGRETPVLEIQPKKTATILWRVAAGILILLTAGFMLYQFVFQNKTTELMATNQIRIESLADGTEVSLNKQSSLVWDKKFNKKERRVSLKGDAYFDVAKNPEKPFIIEADDITIRVLGTAFYVNARDENNKIEVNVSRGTVEVKTRNNEKVILQAGEVAVFDKREDALLKYRNQDKNVMSWKTRVMVFEDTELNEVVKVINRTYQVDIHLANPAIGKCRLTATFDKLLLKDVLTVVAETLSLDLNTTKGKYVLNGSACNE